MCGVTRRSLPEDGGKVQLDGSTAQTPTLQPTLGRTLSATGAERNLDVLVLPSPQRTGKGVFAESCLPEPWGKSFRVETHFVYGILASSVGCPKELFDIAFGVFLFVCILFPLTGAAPYYVPYPRTPVMPHSQMAAGCWLLLVSCLLLAAGCWPSAAGFWLLAAGC